MAEIYYKNGSSYTKMAASDVGAAAKSHTHAASDVGSGSFSTDVLPVVPIEKGGTGATDKRQAATNLAVMTLDRKGGTIPEGADLDTYKTPGCYSCSNTAYVSSILHKPNGASEAFLLDVTYQFGDDYYVGQTLTTFSTGITFFRYFNKGSNSWGPWHRRFDDNATIQVGDGGTGANNATLARMNLGAAKKPTAGRVCYTDNNGADSGRLMSDSLDTETDSLGSIIPTVKAVNTGLGGKVNKLAPGYAAAYTVAADGTQSATRLGSTATGNATDVMQRSGVEAMLSATSVPDPMPVANGGTGAATAEEALVNLGGVARKHVTSDSLYGRTLDNEELMYRVLYTYGESVTDPEHTVYNVKAINEGLNTNYVKRGIGLNKVYSNDALGNVVGLSFSQSSSGGNADLMQRLGVMRMTSDKVSCSYDMVSATFINKGTDLNTLKTPGQYFYYYSDGATELTNCPKVGNFRLLVMDPASYDISSNPQLVQFIIDSGTGAIWARRFYYNAWSAWKKFAFADETTPKIEKLSIGAGWTANFFKESNGIDYDGGTLTLRHYGNSVNFMNINYQAKLMQTVSTAGQYRMDFTTAAFSSSDFNFANATVLSGDVEFVADSGTAYSRSRVWSLGSESATSIYIEFSNYNAMPVLTNCRYVNVTLEATDAPVAS